MKLRSIVFSGLLISAQIPAQAQDLIETYELALENDPTLKQTYNNLLAIGETKDQSIARLLPTISASGGTSHNWVTNEKDNVASQIVGGSGSITFWNNTFFLDLNQPVFHWDYWVQLSQSENQIAQAKAQYEAEAQNLMVRTSTAYFNVLSAQDELRFRNAEKKSIGRQLEQAQQRFEVGLIAITDVYEAQAGYDQSIADVIFAENEVDNAKEALRTIIGDYDAPLAPLGKKLPLPRPQPDDIDTWSENAGTQNLNIIAASNQSEFARKQIGLQRSGHYPTVDIVGSYGITDNNATFGLRGDTQNIGVQVNVPLFEGGGVSSRTRQARHEYNEANDILTETQREVQRQVKNAYRGVITSIGRVKALKAAVVSGESSLEATEAGFDVGTRTMVDVLATTRNLFDAKSKYASSRYDYIINRLELKQSASILNRDDLVSINGFLK